ncbi:MAG: DUF4386 domain-containing protein [Cryomorphaceae bacterium]
MNEMSQSKTVRNLRILYPLWVVMGIFSMLYVPSSLIESGDAVATTANISNHPLLFRLGIAGSLLTQLLYIVIPMLLYRLFENVDKRAATWMLVFALVSVPITMLNEAHQLHILSLLDTPNQVMDALDSYHHGMTISSIFWGLWLTPLGWLAYTSGFFPKFIGISVLVASAGYLLSSFVTIVAPELSLTSSILEFMTFGELIFILWLVGMGVKPIPAATT